MQLTLTGLKDRAAWEKAGIELPGYDVEKVIAKAKEAPRWVHFGIGNIFRIFIGSIADSLLEKGLLDRGMTCVESFDYDVVDKIYAPYDNLGLSVILKRDGTQERKVLGSMSESVKACSSDAKQWARLKEIFRSKDLQIVSFTITEKGYSLEKADGTFFDFVKKDLDNGPDQATHAMCIVTAMLYERFLDGQTPLALVSMDNRSHNGEFLRNAVITVAEEWQSRGFVSSEFVAYVSDETRISFPWTMIDKITPRPSDVIARQLTEAGVEDMAPVITSKRTYIAPFINAEGPQYLVIEDNFPNGRPDLAQGKGVYLGDRRTVNLCERMKVTALLNPVHTATGPLGAALGIELFPKMLEDPIILKMARMVAYTESLPMIEDPVILSPQAFVDELFEDRFPNLYLGDTNLRLCTDASMGLGVRFGETIKSYVAKFSTASTLTAIPLGIAGWLRYLLAVDDNGKAYELAPDPLGMEVAKQLEDVQIGNPDSLKDQLRPILSNENIFYIDLYKAGLGEKIEGMLREMIADYGSTYETVKKYMA